MVFKRLFSNNYSKLKKHQHGIIFNKGPNIGGFYILKTENNTNQK